MNYTKQRNEIMAEIEADHEKQLNKLYEKAMDELGVTITPAQFHEEESWAGAI